MKPFVWKIGKWRCELEDTPRGPLCSCGTRVSPDTIENWIIFYDKAEGNLNSKMKGTNPVMVIAMPWRKDVPTNVIFAEAERRVAELESLAHEYGVDFEELK